MIKEETIAQSVRFCLVGLLNTVIGYGAFYVLLIWFQYLVALSIAQIIGMTNSYFWNRCWTFKMSDKISNFHVIKFIIVYAVAFILNVLILSFLVEHYYINPRIAQIFVLGLITLISFLGHKFWSFYYKEEAKE